MELWRFLCIFAASLKRIDMLVLQDCAQRFLTPVCSVCSKSILWRLFLFLTLEVASPILVHATSIESLTLNVGGSPVVIMLAEHPVITYSGNTLHIKTASTVVDVPVSEITDCVFQNATSIRSVEIPGLQTLRGELQFSSLIPGSRVEVFNVEGFKLQEVVVDSEGKAKVSMDHLSKGVYVIRSASQTIKIINK